MYLIVFFIWFYFSESALRNRVSKLFKETREIICKIKYWSDALQEEKFCYESILYTNEGIPKCLGR